MKGKPKANKMRAFERKEKERKGVKEGSRKDMAMDMKAMKGMGGK